MLYDEGDITITTHNPLFKGEDKVYTIHYSKDQLSEEQKLPNVYNYTGQYQVFTAPINAQYRFELWGAAGGQTLYNGSHRGYLGGRGGYTAGTLHLDEGETLYLFVGGMGQNGIRNGYAQGGWNG